MNDPKDYQTNSVDGAEAYERGRVGEEMEDCMYSDGYEFEDDDLQAERDEQLREEYLDDKFQMEREEN